MASTAFSERIARSTKATRGHLQTDGDGHYAISNQLLVDRRAVAAACQALAGGSEEWVKRCGFEARTLTSVFSGIQLPGGRDVEILELTFASSSENIFSVTRELRASLPDEASGLISPNHILIPASLSDFCPHGAPTPTTLAELRRSWNDPRLRFPLPPPSGAAPVNVTIIDAGYQWNPDVVDGEALWGENPLGGTFTEVEADVLVLSQDSEGVSSWAWAPGTPDVAPARWEGEPASFSPDVVPGGEDELVALAGHANFVAGVIAIGCRAAQITIRNLNGAFNTLNPYELPTEATITRAIAQSAGADLVNVSFAGVLCGDTPGSSWALALERLGPGAVVVAPAGNQQSNLPHYPAALHSSHHQVVGVASTTPPVSATAGLSWSDYGAWVTCACDGTDVRSTFLHVKQRLEDATAPVRYDFSRDSLASWSGTCFAAAKVSARICEEIADAMNAGISIEPLAALGKVLATGYPDPRNELGTILPF